MQANVYELIKHKHAVRQFADEPVPEEVLRQIVDAGRRAPSWKNAQPWRFIVVQDPERRQKIADLNRYARHLAEAAAGVVVVVPEDNESGSVEFDLGRAVQNMMLAAQGMGVSSVVGHMAAPQDTADLLGVPDGYFIAWVVSFGYPAEPQDRPPREGGRLPFDEVVHWETW